jgi:SAM-dependent methyltransferase
MEVAVARTDRPDESIKEIYARKEYLAAYSEHTDLRVERDPHAAIGGMWEEIGNLQFAFVVNHGLLPHDRLLDIGCGTLRGGRHFIRYLDAGNYAGMDISVKAIEYGQSLVRAEGLSEKQPRLLCSRNLNFDEFRGETFGFLLAQSVFTHLMPEHIEECFQHVGSIMSRESKFFFTFQQTSAFRQVGLKDFQYPFSFFGSLAAKQGFTLEDCSEEYAHPRGQKMAKLSRPKSSSAPSSPTVSPAT